jgi:hypothetical protein
MKAAGDGMNCVTDFTPALHWPVISAVAHPVEAARTARRRPASTEMWMMDARRMVPRAYRLCFRSLFDNGRGFAFPCDADGRVDLDGLSESVRNNYLYARAMVGRELAQPAVEPAESHH